MSAYCGQCQVCVDAGAPKCAGCGNAKPGHGWSTDRLLGVSLKDRYRVDVRLKAGPLAVIYAGTDQNDGSAVTIHALRSASLADEAQCNEFTQHQDRLATLTSPYTARIVSTVRDAGVFAYVSETLGETLADALRSRVTIPIAVSLAQQIAESLADAHENGVVHGHLEPRVILLSEGSADLAIKVAGFGDGVGGCTIGTDRAAGRSPAFVPPERVSRSDVDPKTDLYALGAIIFQLVTTQLPHDDPDPMVVFRRKASEPAPSLANLAPHAPERLVALVDSLLAANPDERPENASEVAIELGRVAVALGQTSTRALPAPRRPVRTKLTLAIAVAVGLCVGIGGALVYRTVNTEATAPTAPVESVAPQLAPPVAPAAASVESDRPRSLDASEGAPNAVQP